MAELTMDGRMMGWREPVARPRLSPVGDDLLGDGALVDVRHPAVAQAWVTVAEAAAAAGVASSTIRQWYRNGVVRRARRGGGRGPYMVSLDDVVDRGAGSPSPQPNDGSGPAPDLDGAYWQEEAQRARAEADRANARVRHLNAELAALRGQIERLEAQVEEANRPAIELPGYRGAGRPQERHAFEPDEQHHAVVASSEDVYPGSDEEVIDLNEAAAVSILRPPLYNDDLLPAAPPAERRRRR